MALQSAVTISAQLIVTLPANERKIVSEEPPRVTADIVSDEPHKSSRIQTITDTHALLDIASDVATAGFIHAENIEDAADENSEEVYLGVVENATFVPMLTLRPGVPMVAELATKDIYARTVNTGGSEEARIKFTVIER